MNGILNEFLGTRQGVKHTIGLKDGYKLSSLETKPRTSITQILRHEDSLVLWKIL